MTKVMREEPDVTIQVLWRSQNIGAAFQISPEPGDPPLTPESIAKALIKGLYDGLGGATESSGTVN